MTESPEPSEAPKPAAAKGPRLAPFLPFVSLALALYSLYVAEAAKKDVARMELIKTEYGLFDNLAQLQLQHPMMAHLFTPTYESYDIMVGEVRKAASAQTEEERAVTRLQERAVAHFIFTTYEEAFYVWQQATSAGEARRMEMARDDLAYFNRTFCANPRLLWYWDFDGGKLGQSFAEELGTYVDANVRKGCHTTEDAGGPFTR